MTGLIWAAAVVLLGSATAQAQRSTPAHIIDPAGLANETFGCALAIDGDTMVVGAERGVVGGFQKGDAHVYRWNGAAWQHEAALTASDGANFDFFGAAVAIEGDTIIVGAPQITLPGAAYVYVRSGVTWTQQAKLIASDRVNGDDFGWSVAISGETAIIGADDHTVGGNTGQGAAYVFVRSGTTWTQQAELNASDGGANDDFGIAVAIHGNTAVVGAWTDDVGADIDEGSAYVYVRTGSTWTQQAHLIAPAGAPQDFFGVAVAIQGDTIAVGASLTTISPGFRPGAVHLYERSGTTWAWQTRLTPSDGASSDRFGTTISLAGDNLAVGAPYHDSGGVFDAGSAYVFVRSGGVWTQQAVLTAPDGAAADSFGNAVAVFGDSVAIGAQQDNIGVVNDQGSAWVFNRVGSDWVGADFKILAADGAAGDQFGHSVAISGNTAVVGAWLDAVGSNAVQGSAYVFVRSGPGASWVQQAMLTAADGASSDRFGHAVAISGDTIVVGAQGDTVGTNSNQGSAYVFVRSGSSWSQQAKLTAADGDAGDWFGYSVGVSGDTVVVGSIYDNVGPNISQGSAYVFVRAGTVWSQQTKITAADGVQLTQFGNAVAVSGETAVIGAHDDLVGTNHYQGSAYVYVRSGGTWSQQAKLTASDGADSDEFGWSVSLEGDTLAVGAFLDDWGAGFNQGSAYIFQRTGGSWLQQAKLVAPDGLNGDLFGRSVAVSGGTAIIGGDRHAAYVYLRLGAAWVNVGVLTPIDGATFNNFGYAVALSGGTAVCGARGDDIGPATDRGSAYTFDLSPQDFPIAQNSSTGSLYATVGAALAGSASGQNIDATEAAWRTISIVDTAGRTIHFASAGDIRAPFGSNITLDGSSTVSVPPGNFITLSGQCTANPGGLVEIAGDSLTLGAGGLLTAGAGAQLTITAAVVQLQGQTLLLPGAFVIMSGSAQSTGPVTVGPGATLDALSFINLDSLTVSGGVVSSASLTNLSTAEIYGVSTLLGAYSNAPGATSNIRSGTLVIIGDLDSQGAILGFVCANCSGDPPGLEVEGDLALGSGADLKMPYAGSVVRVAGNADNAINSNTRFDLSLAELHMEGTSAEQTLEVMSRDIGVDALGLDRTIAGHFPIGSFRIGPAATTVRLVDLRDNDGLGQTACEALYVDELVIGPGSRLINPSCRIFYNSIDMQGSVDFPENLVSLVGPSCDPDMNQDGNADQDDVTYLINVVGGGENPTGIDPDFTGDGNADQDDVTALINTIGGGGCP